MLVNFPEILNSKGLYLSSENAKLSFLLFTPFTKCEIRKFHIEVLQQQQRILQKA